MKERVTKESRKTTQTEWSEYISGKVDLLFGNLRS